MAFLKLTGFKELQAKLEALPPKVAGKIAKDAVAKASAPVLADAKANAPVLTGQVRQSLRVKVRKRKTGFSARVQTEAGDYRGDEFYASFSEYGRAGQKAKPFMRPAFDKNVQKCIGIIGDELRAGIESASK